jgi:mono/diheme cytochrome c family protein
MSRCGWWLVVGIAWVLGAVPSVLAGAAARGHPNLGEQIYKEICFACHGLKGDGKGPSWLNTKPSPQVFANPDFTSRWTEEYMFAVVKYGKLKVLKGEAPEIQGLAMPAFDQALEPEQIRELIRYERSHATGTPQGSPEIREIFKDACVTCHGESGQGNGPRAITQQPPPRRFVSEGQPPPADYTNRLVMQRFSDDFLYALIAKGRIGATEEVGFDTMQPFGHILSDEEIWGVVRYIRQTFIDRAP